MNRSISLLTLFSVFSILPVSAYAFTPANILKNSPLDTSPLDNPPQLAQVYANNPIAVDSPLNIEELIVGEADSLVVEREYTFRGKQNQMIVVYLEKSQGHPFNAAVTITDPTGRPVSAKNAYHDGLDLAETDGRHRVFLLPETGEYQISFSGETYAAYYRIDGDETPPSIPEDARPDEYLLRIRLAPYVERLIILGSRMMNEERHEEALAMFTLAIEERPEQPLPYIGRAFSHVSPVFDSIDESTFETKDEFSVVYEAFQGLSPEIQLLVIEDLRQAGMTINALIAAGKTSESKIDINPDIFIEGVTFLETGVASESLREMIEEMYR
ncbi:MAG: hypothetical protein AAF703_20465 [Cyanobacteria bacterium P01_D01_bin.105]